MESANTPNREIVSEIYRALVLLGAENDLLGTVGSWGQSLPEADVLANLRAWNEAVSAQVKERIEHYEMSSRPSGYSRDEGQQKSAA